MHDLKTNTFASFIKFSL